MTNPQLRLSSLKLSPLLLISMTEQLSGVVRVPRRCPECQESSGNWPTESEAQCFSGCVIRRLSACTRVPHRDGKAIGGLPLFNVGIRNRRRCHERQKFFPNWESNSGLLVQIPVHYSLGYHFTTEWKGCRQEEESDGQI